MLRFVQNATRTTIRANLRGCSSLRGNEREVLHLNKGEQKFGFTVFDKFTIEEKKWTFYRLQHNKTNAEYLHIDTSDNENTFAILLNTQPDSSGVAHILEHTTLCGSKRYPVRDPFFNMLKRSLSTYMNAWTGYEWTAYPFSTQNEKDFRNLISVYTDAVFFPNLNRYDFLQEGHRLELSDANDVKSPVVIKGVVYNEMKGAMSQPDRQIIETLNREVFTPNTTYHFNSGGDPEIIPTLTYEKLKQFHATCYHPSNAKFFSYGDLPLERTLEYLNNEVLNKFEKSTPLAPVENVTRFSEPKVVETTYAPYPGVDPEFGNTAIKVYLTNEVTDEFETFVLEMISGLLLKGESSPMYQARMANGGLGKDFSVSTGYQPSTKEAVFGFGLQGISEEQVPLAFDLIQSTIENIANRKNTFSNERIESLLHAVEIGRKQVLNNYGLNLFGDLITPWVHGIDVKKFMNLDEILIRFREALKTEYFLEDKVKQYFVDNTHTIKFIFRPDENYTVKKEQIETDYLSKKNEELSLEEREQILKDQLELEQYQKNVTDPNILPKVDIKDIEHFAEKVELKKREIKNFSVQFANQPTNDLIYFRGFATINQIPEELVEYVPLFCNSFAKMSTPTLNYSDLSQKIQNVTGGVSSSWDIHRNYSFPKDNPFEFGISFSSYALNRNTSSMFDILKEVFTSKIDDIEQLQSIIFMTTSRFEEKLTDSGHQYAMSYSARNLSKQHQLLEQLNGVSYLKYLRSITTPEHLTDILNNLRNIYVYLNEKAPLRFAVNCEEHLFSNVEHGFTNFVENLNTQTRDSLYSSSKNELSSADKVFIPIPAGVNYCALTIPGVSYTHPDFPTLQILSKLLSQNFLHTEIREKGGAYGSGVQAGSAISFYSYRDPNVERTLDTFLKSYDWLKNPSNYTDDDIEAAKLTLFSQLDAPIVPSRKGLSEFKQCLTWEMKQRHRDGIFSSTRDDILAVTEKYFVSNIPHAITVVGNEQLHSSLDSSWKVEAW